MFEAVEDAGDRHAIGTNPIANDVGPIAEANDKLAHLAHLSGSAAFGKVAEAVDGCLERHTERFRIRCVAISKPSFQPFEVKPGGASNNDPPHRSALFSKVQQSSLDLVPRYAACSISLITNRLEFPPVCGVALDEVVAVLGANRRALPRGLAFSEARFLDGALEDAERILFDALTRRRGANPEALCELAINLQDDFAISHVAMMFHPPFVVNAAALYDPAHDNAPALRHAAL